MSFAADAAVWLLNVSSAVLLIFVNKLLLSQSSYSFVFAVTLSAFHYITVAFVLQVYKWSGGMAASKRMGLNQLVLYCGTSSLSIISLNLSLLCNSVGFYQISKLMVIPFVCCVEAVAYRRVFSVPIILSIITVCVGVGVVTVSSVATSVVGFSVAVVSIVAAGSQQLLCGHIQRTSGISSTDMLLQTAWPMGALLLLTGPFLDHSFTGKWVHEHLVDFSVNRIIAVTCLLAIAVNISQFLCLGRFSAVAYQVMGHSKTITVLLGGALFFHDVITPRAGCGMALAVAGMVGYGYLSSQEKKPAPAPKQTEAEEQRAAVVAAMLQEPLIEKAPMPARS